LTGTCPRRERRNMDEPFERLLVPQTPSRFWQPAGPPNVADPILRPAAGPRRGPAQRDLRAARHRFLRRVATTREEVAYLVSSRTTENARRRLDQHRLNRHPQP